MEVANIRYECKLKRLAIEEQLKMQHRIEEQADRQRRFAIEEQMKIKQIEEEEMAKKLQMEAAAAAAASAATVSKKSQKKCNKKLLDKCKRGKKIAPLWHNC